MDRQEKQETDPKAKREREMNGVGDKRRDEQSAEKNRECRCAADGGWGARLPQLSPTVNNKVLRSG